MCRRRCCLRRYCSDATILPAAEFAASRYFRRASQWKPTVSIDMSGQPLKLIRHRAQMIWKVIKMGNGCFGDKANREREKMVVLIIVQILLNIFPQQVRPGMAWMFVYQKHMYIPIQMKWYGRTCVMMNDKKTWIGNARSIHWRLSSHMLTIIESSLFVCLSGRKNLKHYICFTYFFKYYCYY